MDCAGIQELLSEYIDGTLDAKATAGVEKHISACKICKEELIAIRAMVEELGDLEPVKAPSDFLEKIHERMEPRSDFSRLVRKLFVPFRIKIPLQLAAAATAAILVVLVWNIQQPEIQTMQPSKAYKVEGFAETPKADHIKPALKKEAKRLLSIAEEAPGRLSDSEHRMLARKSKDKTTVQPSIQVKPEPSSSFFSKARQSAGKGQPIELALVLKTGDIGRAYAPDIAMESAPLLESDDKTVENERADKHSFGRKIEAIQKDPVDDLLSTMKQIIRPLKGKILAVEYHKQEERIKSIHVQIPTKSYGSFCNELEKLATFKTPPPALIDTRLEAMEFLINFTYPK